MARSKGEQFAILGEILAAVDERRCVSIDDVASQYGITREEALAIVEPVLYVEFNPADGANPITWMHELEFDGEDLMPGIGAEQNGTPIRNLETRPPDHDTALDLYLSAAIMNSLQPNPVLATALEKLADLVPVTLLVPIEQPPALGVVQQAWSQRRSVHTRYLADGRTEATEREIVPWRVYANWGRWYVKGTAVDHGEERTYRVDRMLDARIGDVEYERPDDIPIPQWFDMDHNSRTVRVRMPAAAERSLTAPVVFADRVVLDDGWVEVTVTVHGDPRLDHLLVSLPPEAEVLEPAECVARRRDHAAALLADYS